MGRKPPIIPVSKLLEGCQLCLSNGMQLAEEADLLLQRNSQPHAFLQEQRPSSIHPPFSHRHSAPQTPRSLAQFQVQTLNERTASKP